MTITQLRKKSCHNLVYSPYVVQYVRQNLSMRAIKLRNTMYVFDREKNTKEL